MSRPKYSISIRDLETKHNVSKLERDGFTRRDIIKEMYKKTDGLSDQLRNKMVNQLFDRSEK